MTTTESDLESKLVYRSFQKFFRGQVLENIAYVAIGARGLRSTGRETFELRSEYGRGDSHQVRSMVDAQLRWDFLEEPVACGGKSTRSRVNFCVFQVCQGAVEQPKLLGSKKKKEILRLGIEIPEIQFVVFGDLYPALWGSAYNDDVIG